MINLEINSQKEVEYPYFLTPQAIKILTKLLVVDPSARTYNFEELKKEEFFENVDFEKILS
jgi:hypothetical protein